MKKFKFNLESLLMIRDWEERRARQFLSQASAQVTQLQQRIDFLSTKKDRAYSQWADHGQQRFTVTDRVSLNAEVAEIDGQVEESQEQLNLARSERERAMDALSIATRRKRAVENLKDKRLQEHNAAVERYEMAEMEDIFNARRSST